MKLLLCIISLFVAFTGISCSKNNMSRYDLVWNELTSDPIYPPGVKHNHARRNDGYYDGALMGNGLLGTNFYKLEDGAYRLNVGRSDVTDIRDNGFSLYRSGRLPIGYFVLRTVGNVQEEHMRLHINDAVTTGRIKTDAGTISFKTYVHAVKNAIVFETETSGKENEYAWEFVPYPALSTRFIYFSGDDLGTSRGLDKDYLRVDGRANPDFWREEADGVNLLVQPLAADSTFTKINRYYVVGWKEVSHGGKRRIVATVSQRPELEGAIKLAVHDVLDGLETHRMEKNHIDWWHRFYDGIAKMNFPDEEIQKFYWMQCYKLASTARPDKPIIDLQGVWPVFDTPWPAVWMNLNLQLTYSWQTRLGMGEFMQPLLDALWDNRINLTLNVTDNPGQESWTDCMAVARHCGYDLRCNLDPKLAASNQYEVGNLIWLLFYCHQYCEAYGDDIQMKERVFPLLKNAVNLFFRIRTENSDGTYGLPSTASPEYNEKRGEIGANSNYDLANLKWGLQTLIDLDAQYRINDDLLPQWKDFLERLVPFRYSEKTGFKVSDKYEFSITNHRHYSHLFMIFPYHMLDWDNPLDRARMSLSLDRWNGNSGYSYTGKASMLCSRGDKGDGDRALAIMKQFFSKYITNNTLYNEAGPCMETPFSAMCSLEHMYLQDWGGVLRVFRGCPESWKDCSFSNMRAAGAFLVSAVRKDGETISIHINSEKGGACRIQTGMETFKVSKDYKIVDLNKGIIEILTVPGEIIKISK